MKNIITTICFLLIVSGAFSQSKIKLDNQINVVFGIGQIVQSGFNIEGNIFFNRFVFDYSHGVSLNMSNSQLENGADKEQGLAIQLPWTTGFGLGYRFNNWLNLRVEPKWHKYELYYDGDEQLPSNLIDDYTTFTLGLGLYANLKPFKNQNNFLKGIMVVPNLRWWPKVSSSLNDDELTYDNRITGSVEVHKAREIGIANTPFFANISIGYSF